MAAAGTSEDAAAAAASSPASTSTAPMSGEGSGAVGTGNNTGESTAASSSDEPAPSTTSGMMIMGADSSSAPGDEHTLQATVLRYLPPALQNITPDQRNLFLLATAGAVLLLPGTMQFVASLLLRIVGTALGIGLGLGLAAHIHDALDRMADSHERDSRQQQRLVAGGGGSGERTSKTGASADGHGPAMAASGAGTPGPGSASRMAIRGNKTKAADLLDEDSYHALMASAGYDVPDGLLRGQILRTTSANLMTSSEAAAMATGASSSASVGQMEAPKRPITAATILENTVTDGPNRGKTPNPLYPASVPDSFSQFTSTPTPRGPSTLKRMYPTLPINICTELGTFMDLIMRDFIHCWFCTIDPAVLYEDEKERRHRVEMEREKQAKKAKMMQVLEEGRKATMELAENDNNGIGNDNAGGGGDDGGGTANPESDLVAASAATAATAEEVAPTVTSSSSNNKHSLMVLSTAPLRPSPFPEALYATMATLFGSLAVNARDNVNIMELLLVKIVRVLSLNIKTYRELRKIAVTKQRRRLASARGRVRKATDRQSSSSLRTSGSGAELRSARSHDQLSIVGGGAAANDGRLQRKSSRGSLASPPSSGNGPFFEDGLSAPRARGQSFGAASASGEKDTALPSESDVSEIAMVREYLLAGKLHRAITFGVDVPSLLFADPHGRDCPPPPMDDDGCADGENDEASGDTPRNEDGAGAGAALSGILEDDDVLYARLFSPKSQILAESELDYCRVLSYRLVKETTARVDFDSPTLRTMAVEMVASCVLAPIMSCFSPDMINFGLTRVLEPYAQPNGGGGGGDAATGGGEESKLAGMDIGSDTIRDEDMDLMRGWDQSTSAELAAMDETALSERMEPILGEDTELERESPNKDEMTLVENFDTAVEAGADGGDKSCQNILTLLTMSIIDLQEHLDFDEIKLSRENNAEVRINWDAPSCRAAIRQLVLVVEAALLHGLRARRQASHAHRSKTTEGADVAIGEDAVDDQYPIEEGDMALLDEEEEQAAEDAAHLQPTCIVTLFMEMTEDLDAFEKRVAEEEGLSRHASLDESGHSRDDDDGEAVNTSMHYNDWTASLPPNEVSSLRTLIAAWLHTGQLYRTLSVFLQSRNTILRPFYHSFAFMRDSEASAGFVKQLKVLDGVDVLVDTAAVLRCNSLDLRGELQMESDILGDEEGVDDVDVDDSDGVDDSYFASGGLEPAVGRSEESDTPMQGPFGGSLVGGVRANLRSNRQRLSRLVSTDLVNVASSLTGSGPAATAASTSDAEEKPPPSPLTAAVAAIHMQHQRQTFEAPHLSFSRNAAFSENLRKERERRMTSWAKVAAASHQQNQHVDMIVHTRGLTDRDVQIHRELHGLARAFYSGSVILSISENANASADAVDDGQKQSLIPQISMENVANRRRFEVPDDDSSFLLRASSRRLTPLGVTRNSRDHSQSFITFLATYQEPVLHPKSKRYKGGRLIRQVTIKFFPSDRTATVGPMKENARHMHGNLKAQALPSAGSGRSLSSSKGNAGSSSSTSFLSEEYQRTRHLCQRHMPAGSANVLTASMTPSLMDSDDFVATPRVGKAIDFVYRFHLFEKPVVNIGGKMLTVQDASLKGPHRADASALEISDAALSYALLTLGETFVVADTDDLSGSRNESGDAANASVGSENSSNEEETKVGGISLQRGEEGSPTVILMKIKTSQSRSAGASAESGGIEKEAASSSIMRPFRPSFLRAALLQTSTRQEAQLQCLLTCVKGGSARNATKARTEAFLQPYLTLLEFAVSKKREKQSILLRDLKLGINHIDSSQLIRNKILNPRWPTVLHSLSSVTVEGAIKAKASNDLIGSPAMVLYKIKCAAIVEFIDSDDPEEKFFREEWVILRPFRDFVTLHKHLKKQVSENESSGNAGAKLVGAAAAALTFQTNQRQRRALMPSLGQANKAGALGVTQKSIEKRREILSTYLAYLTDPRHLLHLCPELMRFLGACDAFPAEIDPNAGPDSLGRIHLKRMPLSREVVLHDMMRMGLGASNVNITGAISENSDVASRAAAAAVVSPRGVASSSRLPLSTAKVGSTEDLPAATNAAASVGRKDNVGAAVSAEKKSGGSSSRKKPNSLERARIASIKSQVEAVKLSEVRNGIFRFIRYLFDLDNASFFRSRILSALKTMSFAVTSAQEFHKLLFRMHLQHASSEAMAAWVKFGRDILWPEGVFFDPAPDQDPEELRAQKEQAKSLLMAAFPEQLKTVLGGELAEDGIGLFHEMINNPLILRSLAYQLMDETWTSLFPDLRDFTTGPSVLEN